MKNKRCKVCQAPAVIELPYAYLCLCREHFISFFEKRVLTAMQEEKMCSPEQVVLIGLSGGKDSMSLAHLLKKHSFNVRALYIHMRLGKESDVAEKLVRDFSESAGIPLSLYDVGQELGIDIVKAARALRRETCSVCGMVKRYVLNQVGLSADCVATGHTLDDEASFLMGAVYVPSKDNTFSLRPVLPARQGFAKKIKPLCYMHEYEIRAYAELNAIPFRAEKCPHHAGATTAYYKKVIHYLEEKMPSSTLRFYKGHRKARQEAQAETEISQWCSSCGYPTTGTLCGVCRLRQQTAER